MTEAKGLILEVYRNPLYRCRLNVLDTHNSVTLVRIVQDERWRIPGEEPPTLGIDCEVFAPTAERPAVELAWRVMNGKPCHYIRPLGWTDGKGMSGGAYAGTSDSRWCRLFPFYGAIPIHDRVE